MRRRQIATVLVGPSALLREGLDRIQRGTDFRIVQSVAAIEELQNESLTRQQSPLLVIECEDDVGISVAGIKHFKLDHPSAQIAVLAGSPSIEDLILFFNAGANVLLVKTASRETFVRTLGLAALGETLLPRDFLGHVRSGAPKQQSRTAGRDHEIAGRVDGDLQNGSPQLSDRERSILHCIIQGASNKMIARRLGIAESTVKVHVKTILRKIRAHNRTQAAIWAMNNNVFTSTPEAGLLSHSPVLLLDNSGTGRAADRGDAGGGRRYPSPICTAHRPRPERDARTEADVCSKLMPTPESTCVGVTVFCRRPIWHETIKRLGRPAPHCDHRVVCRSSSSAGTCWK